MIVILWIMLLTGIILWVSLVFMFDLIIESIKKPDILFDSNRIVFPIAIMLISTFIECGCFMHLYRLGVF